MTARRIQIPLDITTDLAGRHTIATPIATGREPVKIVSAMSSYMVSPDIRMESKNGSLTVTGQVRDRLTLDIEYPEAGGPAALTLPDIRPHLS